MRAISRHQDDRQQTADELRSELSAAASAAWGDDWPRRG